MRLALSGFVDCDIGLLNLTKMSESDIDGSGSISPSQSAEQTTDEEDYAVLNLELGAPYQNEPLAVDGGNEKDANDQEDPDGIVANLLEMRYENGGQMLREW